MNSDRAAGTPHCPLGQHDWTVALNATKEDAAHYLFPVRFSVTDGELWDEETITIRLVNI